MANIHLLYKVAPISLLLLQCLALYQTKYNQVFAYDSLLVWSGVGMEGLVSPGRFSRPVAGVEFATGDNISISTALQGGTLLFLLFCSLCRLVPLKSTQLHFSVGLV